MRVLLAEDDHLLGAGVHDALDRAQYTCEWLRDGPSALAAASDHPFDMMILDLGLPGMDGIEVLKRLRARGSKLPVLILSARDAARERVAGLNAGADDYLVKPFELEELLARLRAIDRRRGGSATNELRHGTLLLDLSANTVIWNDQVVELQRREFMLLKKLMENPGRIFSRTQLEEAIYGWESSVESNSVDVHVHHLRRKLYPGVIKTIRGVGYRIDPL